MDAHHTNTTTAPQDAPGALHAYGYARSGTVVRLVVNLALTLTMVPVALGLHALIGALAYVLAGATALVALPVAWQAWGRLRRGEPVLCLGAQGLRDLRIGTQWLPWRAMKAVYLGDVDGDQALLLAFHQSATAQRHLGRRARAAAQAIPLTTRARAPGANAWVNLSGLACRPEDVLAIARRLHQQAMQSPSGQSAAATSQTDGPARR